MSAAGTKTPRPRRAAEPPRCEAVHRSGVRCIMAAEHQPPHLGEGIWWMSSRVPGEGTLRISIKDGRTSRVSVQCNKDGVVIRASLKPDHKAAVLARMQAAAPKTPERLAEVFALWIVEHMAGGPVELRALVSRAVEEAQTAGGAA